jgi:tetratricopeptide (TPR) repeat protein
VYPQFAAAWSLLGETQLALKNEEAAKAAFEKSVAADPKYLKPYLQLALLNLRAGEWAPAAQATERLVALNPFLPQAHYFNAIAHFNLGKLDVAEKSARSAVEGPDAKQLPHAHRLLGAILAKQGQFPAAAQEYRSFLKLNPAGSEADQLRRTLTEWEGLGVIPRAEAAAENK